MKKRKATESRRKFFNVDPPQIWRELKDRIDSGKERRSWDKEVDGTKVEKKKAKKVEKKLEKTDREKRRQEKKQKKQKKQEKTKDKK